MLRLHGITPVMVSPFWDDEGLEGNNLRRQIDFAEHAAGIIEYDDVLADFVQSFGNEFQIRAAHIDIGRGVVGVDLKRIAFR